ncbi:head GIN domain-containing protein [Aquimarina sp. W85]|uniref:head GIN domain-containing protein n=1 Tax=Aquimarina rhodophyticola TaxID=3342246 RepID=UPI00366CE601
MTTLAKILVTLCLALLCYSCNIPFNGVKGTGSVVQTERTIDKPFNRVKASNGLDIILSKNNDNKVIIEANQNLHELIEIYVKDQMLIIKAKENIYSADQKSVLVSYKTLKEITVNSGASITSTQVIEQQKMKLNATSGADIELEIKSESLTTSATSGAFIDISGMVNSHKVSATSGAVIKAQEVLSLITDAKATSGASVKVHAKNEFKGRATSGGNVRYFGAPEKVSEVDNSGGNVSRN